MNVTSSHLGSTSLPVVTCTVDLSRRDQHLVSVRLGIPAGSLESGGRLVIPTWTPGSYVIRDYVHHLQQLTAVDAAGGSMQLEPDGVSAWNVPATSGSVTIDLEWYAFDLSVRTNHVDDQHALLVGAATFPFIESLRAHPHHVYVTGFDATHEVASLLPGEESGPYAADDYEHLVDAAFEVGPLRSARVDVHGVEHTFVWAGHGEGVDVRGLADDLGRLAHAAVELFGGDLPTARYTVIAADGDGGGLEHRDGCVIVFPPHSTTDPERRRRLQSLLAHEYFHLWNVRRMAPAALVDPPLDRPVPTPSLWIAEGWTSYYDRLLPARAGLWNANQLLSTFDRLRQGVEQLPGARLQSLHDASRTAWTKFYRRDENTPNAGTDYYAHGALVAFALDLSLRRVRPDRAGLDDVLREMWRRFGTRRPGLGDGYLEEDVLAILEEQGGPAVAALCHRLTTQPGIPDLSADLAVLGLREVPTTEPLTPNLGVVVSDQTGPVQFASVLREGPAWEAGVSGGDRLLAIDGETLTAAELPVVLRRHGAGARIRLSLQRGPRLLERTVELEAARPRFELAFDPAATDVARAGFRAWSGLDAPA
jgi:predicted metalloprotease with PDZ domain